MDEDTLQTNLNTIMEMILDEEKLVTYVSLSKELCIHVNDSKLLLSKITQEIKEKQPDVMLNITYMVSGLSEDSKSRTTVLLEKEKETLLKTFKVVFFEHIYSINKGLPSVDHVAFLAINKFQDLPLCTGLIKSNSCIKRTSDEIGSLKHNSQEALAIKQKPVIMPQKKIIEESKKVSKNGHEKPKTITKIHETKSEPTIKKEVPSPNKDSSNNTKQKSDNKRNGNKTQKGIAGFFSKSNSAPNQKVMQDTTEKKEEIITKVDKEVVNKQHEVKVEKIDVDEDVEVEKEDVKVEIKKAIKGKSKSKTVYQIKKNAKIDKKRKRVLHVSDSESEDEKDPFADEPDLNNLSEDEIPPTPTINTVKITSGLVNPKKKRKVVDKTYTDDDGYILTKKEVVYESCSDNEEELHAKENVEVQQNNHVKQEPSPKKKNGSKNAKKKISPPQKGKQATLMNFFKKV